MYLPSLTEKEISISKSETCNLLLERKSAFKCRRQVRLWEPIVSSHFTPERSRAGVSFNLKPK